MQGFCLLLLTFESLLITSSWFSSPTTHFWPIPYHFQMVSVFFYTYLTHFNSLMLGFVHYSIHQTQSWVLLHGFWIALKIPDSLLIIFYMLSMFICTFMTHSLSFLNGFCFRQHVSCTLQFTFERFRTQQHTSDSILGTSTWFLCINTSFRLTPYQFFMVSLWNYLFLPHSSSLLNGFGVLQQTSDSILSTSTWFLCINTSVRLTPYQFYLFFDLNYKFLPNSSALLNGFDVLQHTSDSIFSTSPWFLGINTSLGLTSNHFYLVSV